MKVSGVLRIQQEQQERPCGPQHRSAPEERFAGRTEEHIAQQLAEEYCVSVEGARPWHDCGMRIEEEVEDSGTEMRRQ